jgi:SAM-dependent methyltransferase
MTTMETVRPIERPAEIARPTAYRRHVLAQLQQVMGTVPRVERALDFGAGDGWFAGEIARLGIARTVVSADVMVWPGLLNTPVIFDGQRLPFADRTFDLAYAIDVLHHCPDPERAFADVLRCTNTYFLIKDHSYRNILGWSALCVLDELGNRRFGVPTPHCYQKRWSWNDYLTSQGFSLQTLVHPAPCHTGVLGYLTNSLQYVALWRRTAAIDAASPRAAQTRSRG